VTRAELARLQDDVLRSLSDPFAAAVEGIGGADAEHLALAGRLARAKRFAKIEAVLPRTCGALGDDLDDVAQAFARECPAVSSRNRVNALAFYRFLQRRARRGAGFPPYLLEVAFCELALGAVVTERAGDGPDWTTIAASTAIRRPANVRLRVCAFDVRHLFETGDASPPAVARVRPHLAFVADPPRGDPRVVELPEGVFSLLRSLRRWTALPRATNRSTAATVAMLERSGLLEVRARSRSRAAGTSSR
jgi:hypothetical protein